MHPRAAENHSIISSQLFPKEYHTINIHMPCLCIRNTQSPRINSIRRKSFWTNQRRQTFDEKRSIFFTVTNINLVRRLHIYSDLSTVDSFGDFYCCVDLCFYDDEDVASFTTCAPCYPRGAVCRGKKVGLN